MMTLLLLISVILLIFWAGGLCVSLYCDEQNSSLTKHWYFINLSNYEKAIILLYQENEKLNEELKKRRII